MARTKTPNRKVSFSTRIAPATLRQLDELVRFGRYLNRTAAIEAAVARLAADEEEVWERKRRAIEATAGVFSLGLTSEKMRELEYERLEWEAERARGG